MVVEFLKSIHVTDAPKKCIDIKSCGKNAGYGFDGTSLLWFTTIILNNYGYEGENIFLIEKGILFMDYVLKWQNNKLSLLLYTSQSAGCKNW